MVVVEIRRPYFDEETQTIEWQMRGMLRATPEGVHLSVPPDDSTSVLTEPVMEIASGEMVDPETYPERWARSLPDAYRSGDLVAVVVHDDHPVPIETLGSIDEPQIPEPPIPELAESETHAPSVTTTLS